MFLLLFASLLNLQALDTVSTAIEQAQGLALKKNRQEACATLARTLVDTPAPSKVSRQKLSEALNSIAKVFFTDKGQRAYESGQSLMFENPDLAMTQLKEALALEDGNINVLSSLAKLHLAKQDCDGALQLTNKARLMNPLAGEPAVLELRALACQKNFAALTEKAKLLPPTEKWEEQYVQYLLAQSYLFDKLPKKAFDTLSKLVEEQAQFPEGYFYLAKAGNELEKDDETALQKYLSLCRALTVKERKRFSLEPRLCSNMKEAEDELAKKPTDL